MNTYYKYFPNVFLAKCTTKHEKGDIIPVTNKYGKDNDSIIFNLIAEKAGYYYYSIIRADGFNCQKWAQKKIEKFEQFATNASNKSNDYYNASNKDREFLSLGEPIKVGHHSEKRHRRIIEQAQNNMTKCVELSNKKESYESKADYYNSKLETINLSMPESIQYFKNELEKAILKHEGLKNGSIQKSHSYSLVYANKERKDLEKKYNLSIKLWA